MVDGPYFRQRAVDALPCHLFGRDRKSVLRLGVDGLMYQSVKRLRIASIKARSGGSALRAFIIVGNGARIVVCAGSCIGNTKIIAPGDLDYKRGLQTLTELG